MPFRVLAAVCAAFVEWLVKHPVLVYFGYAAYAALMCLVITKRKRRKGGAFLLSFAGSYLPMLSMVYVVLLYAAPYVMEKNGSLGGVLEFAFAVLICIGAIAVLQNINDYHEKSTLECFLGIVFFLLVCLILRYSVGTWEKVEKVYALRGAKMLRILVGFMLP